MHQRTSFVRNGNQSSAKSEIVENLFRSRQMKIKWTTETRPKVKNLQNAKVEWCDKSFVFPRRIPRTGVLHDEFEFFILSKLICLQFHDGRIGSHFRISQVQYPNQFEIGCDCVQSFPWHKPSNTQNTFIVSFNLRNMCTFGTSKSAMRPKLMPNRASGRATVYLLAE